MLISTTAATCPNLVKQGYRGPIYATDATRDLADIMLKDSGHIHEYDVKYVNKKRRKKGLPPVEPLYTLADAARTIPYIKQVPMTPTLSPFLVCAPILLKPGISWGQPRSCWT